MKLSEAVLAEHGLTGAEPYEAVGCSRCGGSGYRGRIGAVRGDDRSPSEIRALILEHGSVDAIVDGRASREGMLRLRDDGLAEGTRRAHLDRRDRTDDLQPALSGGSQLAESSSQRCIGPAGNTTPVASGCGAASPLRDAALEPDRYSLPGGDLLLVLLFALLVLGVAPAVLAFVFALGGERDRLRRQAGAP